MVYVVNDPAEFAAQMQEGFCAAYPDWVRRVPGGVVRSTTVPKGQVAAVTGGGSGHYPAFAGLVGPGLAHGAAMGNIFASPSAQQVYSVAKAAESGGGVLLTYGNYAGDVLNFTQAQERLRAEGIDCHTVVVTDDIASAAPEHSDQRRGIAGDLFVFKVAAAAAEAGRPLAEVVELATRANAATRTLGVAFTGCTLPGSSEPLFTVPHGRMGVGMGIHGEPGIDEQDIPSADELAELLVTRLLQERPEGASDRAVVLLNGLGGVKYGELFVLYRSIARLLAEAGLEIVQPEIGELVTSFEMAGTSLTLSWLQEDLEEYWSVPANTPAYRKGSRPLGERAQVDDAELTDQHRAAQASEASRAAGQVITRALAATEATIDEHVHYLGELDAVAGDGDHGIGMQRGSHAAAAAAQEAAGQGAGAAGVLQAAADAWSDRAGGTSGALWGALLTSMATTLGDTEEVTVERVATAIEGAAGAVRTFGKVELGDKTMVDALTPFAEAFTRAAGAGQDLPGAIRAAATEARTAAEATADLLPRAGRARPHAQKSLGIPDPGAYSFALICQALADLATHNRK